MVSVLQYLIEYACILKFLSNPISKVLENSRLLNSLKLYQCMAAKWGDGGVGREYLCSHRLSLFSNWLYQRKVQEADSKLGARHP